MRWILWLFGGLLLAFVAVGIFGPGGDSPEREAARKRECAEALTSSIGHSTVGYADKVAYDKVVREKCDGLSINGKPLGR